MPRWNMRSALSGVVVALVACSLVACGNATGGVGAVGTAKPTQGVIVEVGAASYATSDTIAVTVRNALAISILATDHQTACTIVQLQIESNGSWQNQGGCAMGIATRQVPLAADSSVAVQLAPTAGQISAKPWPAGTYRVAFTYVAGPNVTAGENHTVYSTPFTVS